MVRKFYYLKEKESSQKKILIKLSNRANLNLVMGLIVSRCER